MEILFEDKNLIICVKPVGLDSEKEMVDAIKEKYSGEIYTVHRLDKNVGGVMVYARNKHTAALLSKHIQDGNMIKEYVAMVHGTPDLKGDWEDLLWKDSTKNKVFVVKRERKGVKKARLEYTCLLQDNPSIVKIRLHTGRSHQIRVQFASRGFPLIGDHKYGSRDSSSNPMLFSCCITFPYQKELIKFEYYPDWAKAFI
ncbi:MAG: RluA family pseudouridine synthase [Erysipelotrichaceae bacterium]|nr:RluA family pseudouridine synthase [Erysipelotrichaceae bacterium]